MIDWEKPFVGYATKTDIRNVVERVYGNKIFGTPLKIRDNCVKIELTNSKGKNDVLTNENAVEVAKQLSEISKTKITYYSMGYSMDTGFDSITLLIDKNTPKYLKDLV